jgi:AraC-like DNA-binding protein
MDIQLKIDIFALLMFLGTIQGFFLSYFFLNKKNRQHKANIFLGLFVLACALSSLDILLCYTNYMFRVIHLVDFSEPLNFAFGPLICLYIRAKLDEKNIKKAYFHFIPFVLYLIYHLPFNLKDVNAKYNSYINSYHQEMDFLTVQGYEAIDFLYLKDYIHELTIFSFLVYLLLTVYHLVSAHRQETPDENRKKLFVFLWFITGLYGVVIISLWFARIFFTADLGEYIIISIITLLLYSLSFKIMRDSIFFQKKQFKKYSKSVLNEKQKEQILNKIKQVMEEKKYYLDSSASLPGLAKIMNQSSNHVSQVINECLNLTFFDLLAEYRIEEAKKIMHNLARQSDTIEGIAYDVGYNSKSTFNKAFKKITGITPSEFKQLMQRSSKD